MWKCANCGEEENEDSFKFCLTCGSPVLDFERKERARRDLDVEVAFNLFTDPSPPQNGEERPAEPTTPPPRPATFPQSLRSLGRKMKDVLPINNGHLNHVKLSSQAQAKLDTLVQAGVFSSKAKAAAYLIERGIQAETDLFNVVQQKLLEIERIEQELRNLVKAERA
jgi:hypothetical protein